MNTSFLEKWEYYYYFLQFFTSNFIHWDIMHLLFNALFIYIFWNIVEIIIWKKKYLSFFIFISLFNWVLLSIFASHQNTIWISWFALAILTYYTLQLKSQNDPDYKWWITAIIINIWIWFLPWISLFWHIFWVIWWIIFYLINRNFLSRQEIWFIENLKDIISKSKVINPKNLKKD
jgi:membrane associated rhomboid family serine protease